MGVKDFAGFSLPLAPANTARRKLGLTPVLRLLKQGQRGINPNIRKNCSLPRIFSLDEIAAMFTPSGPSVDRALLLEKAAELEKKIRKLTAVRDGLRHAAACRAPSHVECPTFLRLMRIAGKNRFRKSIKLKSKQRGRRAARGKSG